MTPSRVYLWLGMLSEEGSRQGAWWRTSPHAGRARPHRAPFPERVDTQQCRPGQRAGRLCRRPAALSRSAAHGGHPARQVSAHSLDADAYYGSVLSLFGAGWDQGATASPPTAPATGLERVMPGRVILGACSRLSGERPLAQETVRPALAAGAGPG